MKDCARLSKLTEQYLNRAINNLIKENYRIHTHTHKARTLELNKKKSEYKNISCASIKQTIFNWLVFMMCALIVNTFEFLQRIMMSLMME